MAVVRHDLEQYGKCVQGSGRGTPKSLAVIRHDLEQYGKCIQGSGRGTPKILPPASRRQPLL